jgi:ATP adenylyltransferase/5',5'''-P-1,P-4-tetraphosphate phosphorylase II
LNNKIIDDPEINNYLNQNNFSDAAKLLLEKQKENWTQLKEGYESLKNVKEKIFSFDHFEIKVHFNPGRIKSSSAKVDSKSVKERKCFLCEKNLPEEQKAIRYKNEFNILCNPFPIFPQHFTISNKNHVPQEIKNSFGKLLSLAKDLSKYYVVFYNGPKCGASAPDHLHFQAGTKNFMPIDNKFSVLKDKYGVKLFENENLILSAIDDGFRRFLSFQSKQAKEIEDIFNVFYEIYSHISIKEEEPMMNILVFHDEFGWRVLIFLREKHRPAFYFDKKMQVLWSPAAVDLGGIVITPLEKDFTVISKRLIDEGFNEVTILKEKFHFIKEKIIENLKGKTS